MLFNSLEFLIFLPVVFGLYWFAFKALRWQNLFVVVASYVFYGWWDWRFLLLIAFTTLCSYLSGLAIGQLEGNRRAQRAVSVANIVLNLLILGVFKYYNFFVENLDALCAACGFQLGWTARNIILPVGISFYTFQALSYTIDVYRHKIPVARDVVAFFAFVSFFPQLVAGPIERATNLLPQFLKPRRFDYARAVDGCRQMLWGFFKKLVVADNCALAVNAVWRDYASMPGSTLAVVAVLFAFQIYCDFSGYSDIAIGCARLFGIDLMRNFNVPYFSRNISEFWQRWHISLMTWFRDYIYFPLGGSRCGVSKTIRNTMIVFAISGLWHGANWTYVCWGLYNGLLVSLGLLIGWKSADKRVVAAGRWLPSVKDALQVLITFALCCLGWIIFRAPDIHQAAGYVQHLFATLFTIGPMPWKKTCLFILLMVVVEWLQRDKQHALQFASGSVLGRYRALRWAVYYAILVVIVTCMGVSQTFIYFQF